MKYYLNQGDYDKAGEQYQLAVEVSPRPVTTQTLLHCQLILFAALS